MSSKTNYDKFPVTRISYPEPCAWSGWENVIARLHSAIAPFGDQCVLVVDCYPGILDGEVFAALKNGLHPDLAIHTEDLMKPAHEIEVMTQPFIGDDPVFGRMTSLCLEDYFDPQKFHDQRRLISQTTGRILVFGPGAALLVMHPSILVYADLARWEIQNRFRRNTISNLGLQNQTAPWPAQYKRGYFNDWRICDRHKIQIFDSIDFFLDTNTPDEPKLLSGDAMRTGLRQMTARPFRVVPFFDPAPWGGQWMKSRFGLDSGKVNYGWGFDCVPEENSLLLRFGNITTEIPAINLVLRHPREILDEAVHGRFGAEFPIRFDLLDTIGGGNLSFQVHPLTEYIHQHFGMCYTQDESYYILDALPDATVYLGLKDDVAPKEMADALAHARRGTQAFDVEKFVNRWPSRKHDHFLIPAGTCHCSGAGCLVLEISATPYIFTFKLWDWGRNGLDDLPRPVHLDHGLANLQWDRTRDWTQHNLINQHTALDDGPGWREERTGLHEMEFIETRRHWFISSVSHHTDGGVNVLNLVEGDAILVESPTNAFDPLVIHYAETFIIPAAVGPYTIRPLTPGGDKQYATIKAFVRT